MMDSSTDLSRFSEGIKKTGFKLEFDISSILSSHGWIVINNKYYIDDQKDSVREIDLVAYKATSVLHFHVYTTLIISCKKNAKDALALLTKVRDPKDLNMDWYPFHAWTNDQVIEFMLEKSDGKDKYFSYSKSNGATVLTDKPDKQVFAFQQMDKKKGSPGNDKPIFNSITGLMKAQAYEMSVLPDRKKAPSVYQFNLLSVMDMDLIRLDFSGEDIEPKIVMDDKYVANYIIDKQQTFAKVHFIQASHFNDLLDDYDKMHISNTNSFSQIYEDFYLDAVKDKGKLDVFLDALKKEIVWEIQKKALRVHMINIEFTDSWLAWSEASSSLIFYVDTDHDDWDKIENLNNDEELINILAAGIKKYYRYTGAVKFEATIIF